jgi:tRNA threonylcarbamoyladenosine biosynthesis protein TsaB
VKDGEIIILAVDTTSAHGSLALLQGRQLLECLEVEAPQSFSRVLFGEIESLLERHNLTLPEIDLYAAAAGPGSFTGVRVGLTAAKGLAVAHGKRVAPVSNLAATALLACELAEASLPRLLIPVLDARRGELYAGVYERVSDAPPAMPLRLVMQEVVGPAAALQERLAGLPLALDDAAFCGPDVERLPLAHFRRLTTGRALAGAVALLAWHAHQAGASLVPEEADANYVRRSDAEIFSSHP